MILSKNKSVKNGKTYINLIVNDNQVRDCKTLGYKQISFNTEEKLLIDGKEYTVDSIFAKLPMSKPLKAKAE
jgi:hypothetical protein